MIKKFYFFKHMEQTRNESKNIKTYDNTTSRQRGLFFNSYYHLHNTLCNISFLIVITCYFICSYVLLDLDSYFHALKLLHMNKKTILKGVLTLSSFFIAFILLIYRILFEECKRKDIRVKKAI